MSSGLLTFEQVAGVVVFAVMLAASDPAALSRIGTTWIAKKAGVRPTEIQNYEAATDGNEDTEPQEGN
jgi:hypothetical protein